MRISFLLFFCALWFNQSYSQCTDLYFSEYLEGSSSNKALEIYNPTKNAVDLTDYVLYRYNNGSTTPTDSLFPQGTLGSDKVYIVGNPGADTAITNKADTLHSMTFYNGDDAISLINKANGDTLDIIGEIGVDPGTGWTVGTGATNNFTLIRQKTIKDGQTDWSISVSEWDVFPINTFDSLGSHTVVGCFTAGPGCSDDLFFSEYIEGSSSNKAFEIYNPTGDTADLTDYVVYRYNNGSQTPTDSLFPQGLLLSDSVFVVGNPSANAAIQAQADTTHTMTFYNGDDAMALINKVTGDTLDIIGEIGVDPGQGWTVGSGSTQNHTLIRKKKIQEGQTNWSIPATQWDVFPIDMVDSLGAHTKSPCTFPFCTETINLGPVFLANDPHQSKFRASSTLTAEGIVTSSNMEALSFKAGTSVDLLPVFEVELGAQLSIQIEDCMTGFLQSTRKSALKSREQY